MPPDTGSVPVAVGVVDVPVKLAVTLWLLPMLMEHNPVPLQAPDQPANFEPDAGEALSVTTVPAENDTEHDELQLTPAGDEVTVPAPLEIDESV
jgi:hypothetical protein